MSYDSFSELVHMAKTLQLRIGWAIAPACFASAIRNIHVKLTNSAPAPFQEAALTTLSSPPDYYESLRRVGPGRLLLDFVMDYL